MSIKWDENDTFPMSGYKTVAKLNGSSIEIWTDDWETLLGYLPSYGTEQEHLFGAVRIYESGQRDGVEQGKAIVRQAIKAALGITAALLILLPANLYARSPRYHMPSWEVQAELDALDRIERRAEEREYKRQQERRREREERRREQRRKIEVEEEELDDWEDWDE